MDAGQTMIDKRQRRANLRLGLILATISLVLAFGFVARMVWFGH